MSSSEGGHGERVALTLGCGTSSGRSRRTMRTMRTLKGERERSWSAGTGCESGRHHRTTRRRYTSDHSRRPRAADEMPSSSGSRPSSTSGPRSSLASPTASSRGTGTQVTPVLPPTLISYGARHVKARIDGNVPLDEVIKQLCSSMCVRDLPASSCAQAVLAVSSESASQRLSLRSGMRRTMTSSLKTTFMPSSCPAPRSSSSPRPSSKPRR